MHAVHRQWFFIRRKATFRIDHFNHRPNFNLSENSPIGGIAQKHNQDCSCGHRSQQRPYEYKNGHVTLNREKSMRTCGAKGNCFDIKPSFVSKMTEQFFY